jgi:hypothetical protein
LKNPLFEMAYRIHRTLRTAATTEAGFDNRVWYIGDLDVLVN